jgi:hypothetical protein
VEPLAVRDLASRYVLCIQLMSQQNVESAIPVFRKLFAKYGMPLTIRVDNGSPFGSKGAAGLTRLSAWWVKLGIEVEFTRPGHPEDNGAHEQLNGVLKVETASPPAQTWRGQQRRTNRWVEEYNQIRPHEGIGMKAPAMLYKVSARRMPEESRRLSYPQEWETRFIKRNGMMNWRGQMRYIGEAFGGERVGLKSKRPGVWRVYFGKLLIGEFAERLPGGMSPAKYRRRRTKS